MKIETKVYSVKQLPLGIVNLRHFDDLDEKTQQGVVKIYQDSFALPPYEEHFTEEEVRHWMRHLSSLNRPRIFVLMFRSEPLALAAGNFKSHDVFWLEELAVAPDMQGNGFGRLLLWEAINHGLNNGAKSVQLRTTTANNKSRNLYEDVGMKTVGKYVLASHMRVDGTISVDKRVYYAYPQASVDRMKAKKYLQRLVIAYPSGNTTALVLDQDPATLGMNRKMLNDAIISGNPDYSIEQCGFILPATDPESGAIARLEMFGGEFCGNATRSAVHLLTGGVDSQGLVEVSGSDQVLAWEVKDKVVKVQMPLPTTNLTTQTPDGTLVHLDGITHLVVVKDHSPASESEFEAFADEMLRKHYLKEQAAAGVSWYDTSSNTSHFRVYVKAVDTLFDETACGSGTCSIGIVLSNGNNISKAVIQPSGESIQVEVLNGKAYISGPVSIKYDGRFDLD